LDPAKDRGPSDMHRAHPGGEMVTTIEAQGKAWPGRTASRKGGKRAKRCRGKVEVKGGPPYSSQAGEVWNPSNSLWHHGVRNQKPRVQNRVEKDVNLSKQSPGGSNE